MTVHPARGQSVAIATMTTEHFDFEAFGATVAEAHDALLAGLNRHGQEYDLPYDWYTGYDIDTRTATIGRAYRDREPV